MKNILRFLFPYKMWLKLREESRDEFGERLCYCGHTSHCVCADPDKECFRESVKRGSIILWDEKNGWHDYES